jgi:nitroreductase
MSDPSPRRRGLEAAADAALLAPSVHNTQPWRVLVHDDRLELRADRTRQLSALDPQGRELVISAGAALLNARVGLAAVGWGAECVRYPGIGDADLLAVLRPLPTPPDSALAVLAPALARRHTNRRAFGPEALPAEERRRLADLAAEEETRLVTVLGEGRRQALARLTQQADRVQNEDPAYRAELTQWTTRPRDAGDGVPAAAVARGRYGRRDDLPLRDFDTGGAARLPAETRSDRSQTLVLLATDTDEPRAWLRAGEAMERILLELTVLGWMATPVTQPLEVPATRSQLQSSLTWQAYPQMLLRIGRAATTPRTPRRPRADVVIADPPPKGSGVPDRQSPRGRGEPDTPHGPAPDGRGGTAWR